MRYRSTSVFVFLLSCAAVHGQTIPCDPRIIPVSVVLPNGSMLRGLEGKHFEAQPRQELKTVPDLGPRRVLVMIDLGQQINEHGWKIAIRLATLATTKARASDRIGLTTFNGPVSRVNFEEPRESVVQQITSLVKNRPVGDNKTHIYDALNEAANSFGEHRYGDSILLLSAGIDSGSKVKDKDIESLLQERGIRLFVIALTDETKSSESFEIVMPTQRAMRERETALGGSKSLLLGNVAVASGGALISENTRPPDRAYLWNEERVQKLEAIVWSFYAQIVETYRFEMAAPREPKVTPWELNLIPELRKQFPSYGILYPRKLVPCSAQP